ncbi:MAG: hypothetical protein Q7J06_09100 [Bacteroidales bacterium]|nr:hypothetical protein [Bacteroidales bacterium]
MLILASQAPQAGVVAYEKRTGKIKWTTPSLGPVGYVSPAIVKVEKKADGSYGVTELYKNSDFGAHTQPPVLYNGYFYAQYSTNERKDGMVCMSMDGQVKWKTRRSPLFDKGGCSILVNGLMLSTDGSSKLYLIELDPSAFKPIATSDLLKAVFY